MTSNQFTRLLSDAQRGDATAADQILPLIYEQLRGLARQKMSAERAGHTMQATALVHEAYLRLIGNRELVWSDRGQFFLAAAEAMRRILIDHARARNGPRRGGKRARLPLSAIDLASDDQNLEILDLDDAISRLGKQSPQVEAVVRLRFFAGLSVEDTAMALGISVSTVKREWTYARAALLEQLGEG